MKTLKHSIRFLFLFVATVAVTAIARELAGFVWAIGREVKPA